MQQRTPFLATLTLGSIKTIHIINVYTHPSKPFNQVHEALVQELETLRGEVIVVGDFNAHHPN